MQWHSVSEFLNMGGYAFYVWGSFGITFLCMLLELLSIRARRARVTKMIKQEAF